jgi:hypothetical protein
MRRPLVATLGQGARHYSGASRPAKTAKDQCLTTPGQCLVRRRSVTLAVVEFHPPAGARLSELQRTRAEGSVVADRAEDRGAGCASVHGHLPNLVAPVSPAAGGLEGGEVLGASRGGTSPTISCRLDVFGEGGDGFGGHQRAGHSAAPLYPRFEEGPSDHRCRCRRRGSVRLRVRGSRCRLLAVRTASGEQRHREDQDWDSAAHERQNPGSAL